MKPVRGAGSVPKRMTAIRRLELIALTTVVLFFVSPAIAIPLFIALVVATRGWMNDARRAAPSGVPIRLTRLDRGFLICTQAVAVVLPMYLVTDALVHPTPQTDLALLATPLVLGVVVLGLMGLRSYMRLLDK